MVGGMQMVSMAFSYNDGGKTEKEMTDFIESIASN